MVSGSDGLMDKCSGYTRMAVEARGYKEGPY